MQNLIFKDADRALDYVVNFFKVTELKNKESYYGVVRHIDKSAQPNCYAIEVVVKKRKLFSSKITRQLVVGLKHSEMKNELNEGSLVIWGCDDTTKKIPIGYVLYLLKPEFNIRVGHFEKI